MGFAKCRYGSSVAISAAIIDCDRWSYHGIRAHSSVPKLKCDDHLLMTDTAIIGPMKLVPHIVVSGSAGAVIWMGSGEPETIAIAILAGTLPDLDHILDFWNWYVRKNTEKLYLFFHGWEYLGLMIMINSLLWPEPWMLSITAGYATQIGTDQLFNGVRWRAYFILMRAAAGFQWQAAHLERPADDAYLAAINSLPFYRRRFRRWFEARKPR